METILITGGLGYIGSHTTLKLLEKGKNILIIDSLENSTLDTLCHYGALVVDRMTYKSGTLLAIFVLQIYHIEYNLLG